MQSKHVKTVPGAASVAVPEYDIAETHLLHPGGQGTQVLAA